MGERFRKHKVLFAALYAVLLFVLWHGFQKIKNTSDLMVYTETQTEESADADEKVKFTGNSGIEFDIGNTVEKKLWTQTTIYPNNIPDTFVIDVCLPEDYDERISYPVVYLTDCYWRREDYKKIRNLYQSGKTKEFILVGIGYPDDYDFDTIRSRELIDDPDSFLSLIVNGIMPYAESSYNIDAADRTFCGASYGGYFMLYSLFQSDGITEDVFKNYILASPTFQKKSYGQYLAAYEEDYRNRGNTDLNANVYMTVGAEESFYFVESFGDFIEQLDSRDYSGLNVTSKVYEGKEHYTVWVPTLLEGLEMYLSK